MDLLSNFILGAGILVHFILIFLLLKGKEKNIEKQILSLIFFLLGMVIIHSFGELNHVLWMIYLGFPFADSIGFLIGPLFYLYVLAIYESQILIGIKPYRHFIPAMLYLAIISIPSLVFSILDKEVFYYLKYVNDREYLLHFQGIYLFLYVAYCYKKLGTYQKLLKDHFANLNKKDLKWIKFFFLGIMSLMLLDIILEITSVTQKNLKLDPDIFITLPLILLIVYLAYFGTTQSKILLPITALQAIPQPDQKLPKGGHHLTNASEEEIKELQKKLEDKLELEKIYRHEDLSLASLAIEIQTTGRKLSALLNHHLKTSFYDLINHYRIEEIKERMADPKFDKYTLLALAFEAGFSSKSSFNRIFKKETGESPSVYKKKIQKK